MYTSLFVGQGWIVIKWSQVLNRYLKYMTLQELKMKIVNACSSSQTFSQAGGIARHVYMHTHIHVHMHTHMHTHKPQKFMYKLALLLQPTHKFTCIFFLGFDWASVQISLHIIVIHLNVMVLYYPKYSFECCRGLIFAWQVSFSLLMSSQNQNTVD